MHRIKVTNRLKGRQQNNIRYVIGELTKPVIIIFLPNYIIWPVFAIFSGRPGTANFPDSCVGLNQIL